MEILGCSEPWVYGRERVLFIGTQFSILYTSMYSPAEAATPLTLGSSDSIGTKCVCLLLQYLLHVTREEPGTLTQDAPVSPGSGWLV